jgi:hypothetical protein
MPRVLGVVLKEPKHPCVSFFSQIHPQGRKLSRRNIQGWQPNATLRCLDDITSGEQSLISKMCIIIPSSKITMRMESVSRYVVLGRVNGPVN